MKYLLLLLSLNVSEPKEPVIKFYDWYLKMLETGKMYDMVRPENRAGQARLRYQPYLAAIKQLNLFHDDFFRSEESTFDICDSFLTKWTWEKYRWEEPMYDGYCDFLDYYRWFWTQEPVTEIEIQDQTVDGDRAKVKLLGLYVEGNDRISQTLDIVVRLKKESGNWLITSISYKK